MVPLGVLVVGQCVEDAIGYGRSQLPVLGAGQVVFPLAGSYVVLSGCEGHVANSPLIVGLLRIMRDRSWRWTKDIRMSVSNTHVNRK